MRTALLSLTLVLAAIHVRAADPGPKAGFQEFSWGDKPGHMVLVRLPHGHRPLDLYWNADHLGANHRPVIAGRTAKPVDYYFFKKRLCRVEVSWEGTQRLELNAIGSELVNAWGSADTTSESGERLWHSKDGKTLAVLEHDSAKSATTLTILEKACARKVGTTAAGL